MLIGDCHYRVHVAGRARHVNRGDEPGALGDLRGQIVRVHVETVVHLAKDRDGVAPNHSRYGGHPHECGDYNLIARADPQGPHCRTQRAGAAVDRQGVGNTVEGARIFFQLIYMRRRLGALISEQVAFAYDVGDRFFLLPAQPVHARKSARPIISIRDSLISRSVGNTKSPLQNNSITAVTNHYFELSGFNGSDKMTIDQRQMSGP